MRGILPVKGLRERHIGSVLCVNPTQHEELSGIARLKSFSLLFDVFGSANLEASVRVLGGEIDHSLPPSTHRLLSTQFFSQAWGEC